MQAISGIGMLVAGFISSRTSSTYIALPFSFSCLGSAARYGLRASMHAPRLDSSRPHKFGGKSVYYKAQTFNPSPFTMTPYPRPPSNSNHPITHAVNRASMLCKNSRRSGLAEMPPKRDAIQNSRAGSGLPTMGLMHFRIGGLFESIPGSRASKCWPLDQCKGVQGVEGSLGHIALALDCRGSWGAPG